ncbi:MAG TPA: hypothetical protein PLU35_01680 [Phycisphaerales bacterium]|nr:hypothetical protein [Phycisphaerales bacterium]
MSDDTIQHTEIASDDIGAADPQPYTGPLLAMLHAGDPRPQGDGMGGTVESWWDYAARFGIGPEHADDLIRMATDEALLLDAGEPGCWAPVHAWRALGQLRAKAAIAPLLDMLNVIDRFDDDWGFEEIPEVIGMMGVDAVDPALHFAADRNNRLYARIAALRAPKEAMRHAAPSAERTSLWIAALRSMLDRCDEESPAFNAFVIASFIDLRATDALDDIRRAFEGGHVDELVCGDWEDVCAEMHGLPPPPRKRPPAHLLRAGPATSAAGSGDARGLSAVAGEPIARMQQQWNKARKQRDRKQRKNRRK